MEINDWKHLSMGDKDLWHLAWILTGTDFGLIPFLGLTCSWNIKNIHYHMVSQIKFDPTGRKDMVIG